MIILPAVHLNIYDLKSVPRLHTIYELSQNLIHLVRRVYQ